MIEMLHMSAFWDTVSRTQPFVSAHICEGPGGFLQHVVEHAKLLKLPITSLHAMTLKPTKSHIPGWRRSIGFLRKHPQIQLEYGADDTGNILLPSNQRAFCKRLADQGYAQIFTADGGFDFSIDYGKQEESAFPLLLASFTMGLRSLRKGGTMIIKLFDIYSDATQDLFLGSATLFKSFTLYKPATSRPCNSERYFIGRGFLGVDAAATWAAHLEDAQALHAASPLTRLIGGDWPIAMKNAVVEQIQWQEELQLDAIHDTLTFTRDTMVERIENNIALSKEWCRVFHVRH
jgi:cap2 methyltransferase